MTDTKQFTPEQLKFKKELEAYNNLHEFFNTEHGLILTNHEMDDIVVAVELFKLSKIENKDY